jgi:hypothetical protein
VYDSTADVDALVTSVEVFADPIWVDKTPKGWSYKDKAGTQDGVGKLQLKPGVEDKSKAQLSAKGASAPLPAPVGGGNYFEQDPRVTVQLVNSDGTCWTSEFGDSDTSKNDEAQFKAVDK